MSGRRGPPPARFDLRFKGVGRINNRHGLTSRTDYEDARSLLRRLGRPPLARIDLLRAYKAGDVSLVELAAWDRDGLLASSLTDLRLRDHLWPTVDALVAGLGRGKDTSKRYAVSFAKLRRLGPLGERARIEELRDVDWRRLRSKWPGSSSDWNHLRRAVSRLLTVVCGDKYHPFRRAVVTRIDVEPEVERVPDVSTDLFRALVAKVPEHVRPAYWCIVLTGARLREYLRMGDLNLLPATREVRLPVSKPRPGWRYVPIDPALWHWIVEAVPSPVGEKRLRYYWHRACDALEVPRTRLHDIRHLFGQFLADAGVDERDIQRLMGHKDPKMTRRYTQRAHAREAAGALASHLAPSRRRRRA